MSSKRSYSQSGEDRIVVFLLNAMRLNRPVRYLDIGSAHPVGDNNTFLFCELGGNGVLVEADPQYQPLYREFRPRDVLISAACVPERMGGAGTIDFFVADDPGWSTVSAAHSLIGESLGKGGIQRKLTVPTISVNQLLSRYFADSPPDILSIDIEGVDGEVLRELDFSVHRPSIVVAENSGGERVHDFILLSKGYKLVGYTFVNSVYLNADLLASMTF